MLKNLYAYTEATPTDGYPGFVNLSQQNDGTVTLTVRSPGSGGNQMGVLTLPRAICEELGRALAPQRTVVAHPSNVYDD